MSEKSNQIIGQQGENTAVQFLESLGYTILERNYKFDRCEVDIVAQDKNTLVFVEVKAGKSTRYGAPELRVDRRKEKQLAIAAEGYLTQHPMDDFDCRFDVISVTWDHGRAAVEHIREAFWLEEDD